MTASLPGERADEHAFLDSVEGEISFFRSIMRARPVGIHRHFHIMAIRNFISKDTGRLVHIDAIWEKLRKCYDLDALDAIVCHLFFRAELCKLTECVGRGFFFYTQDLESEGYLSPKSNTSTPVSVGSPSPTENLAAHPFFRDEFSLPFDEEYEAIISQRRMRATVSAPSSPAASPIPVTPAPILSTSASTSANKRGGGSRKRGKYTKSKLNLAGLVGGDSDSSALTQESGDEAVVPETPMESVVTGTDAGTDYAEDEDAEMRDPSPGALGWCSIQFRTSFLILFLSIVSTWIVAETFAWASIKSRAERTSRTNAWWPGARD